jgi:elongation factor P--beta-lysine ligase
MTVDPEQRFSPVEPLNHVDNLTSVTERVARKQEQENKRRRRKGGSKQQIDEQLAEKMAEGEDPSGDGHIDFHA